MLGIVMLVLDRVPRALRPEDTSNARQSDLKTAVWLHPRAESVELSRQRVHVCDVSFTYAPPMYLHIRRLSAGTCGVLIYLWAFAMPTCPHFGGSTCFMAVRRRSEGTAESRNLCSCKALQAF